MKKILLTLVGGLLLGALVTAYFLGAPRVRSMPGVPLKPPNRSGDNSGTVSVTIDEKFFDIHIEWKTLKDQNEDYKEVVD